MIGQQYYTPEDGWIRKDIVNNRGEFTIVGGGFYNNGFQGPGIYHSCQYNFKEIKYNLPANIKSIRIIGLLESESNISAKVYLDGRLLGGLYSLHYTNNFAGGFYKSCFEKTININAPAQLLIQSDIKESGGWWLHFHALDYLVGRPEYYILYDDNYKTITEAGLQTLTDFRATAKSMQANGFTNTQLLADVAEQLPDSFDLLRYHPDNANTSVQITHLPSPQLVTATTDLNLSAYSLIKQITLTTSGSSGAARVVFSFDRGATWHTYADGSWQAIALTVEAVAAGGITPKAFQAIPSEQWAAAVTGPMRVAYYLAKSTATDDLAVNTLIITGDTALWSKARRAVDYNGLLPNTGTMIIQLLTDGSYKINYMSNQ